MEAVQAVVEEACLMLRQHDGQARKRAEEVLLEFRRSPRPIPACIHILQHSTVIEACFQAAVTLRDAALDGWPLLAAQQKAELRHWLLEYLLRAGSRQESGASAVLHTLTAAYASLVKRQWLELDAQQRQATFQECCALAGDQSDSAKVHLGLRLLEALVFEFCPPTSSRLGMSWTFHADCGTAFELDNLLPAYELGARVAAATAFSAASNASHAALCSDALAVMSTVLGWEFNRTEANRFSAGRFGFAHAVNRQEDQTISPGARWRGALLTPPPGDDWLLHLLRTLRTSHADEAGLGARSRSVLVQMCSLTGDVFPPVNKDPTLLHSHLGRCVQRIVALARPVDDLLRAAQQDLRPEPLVDCCKAVHALCFNYAPRDIQGAVSAELPELLGLVAQLLEGCIWCGGASEDLGDEWQGVATGLLLESWTSLLQLRTVDPGADLAALPALDAGTVSIVRLLVDAHLKDLVDGAADESADDAANESGRETAEDVLGRVASLARACLPVSLPLQHSLLAARLQALRSLEGPPTDASERVKGETLEQMCWLVQLAAHTLADSGLGETPMIPGELVAMCEAGSCEPIGAARALADLLCEIAGLSVSDARQQFCSPRLLEAAVAAVARWLDTYVSPAEYVPDGCEALALEDAAAAAVLERMLQVAHSCLSNFPGEVQLQRVATERLLHVMVVRWPRCSDTWAQPTWHVLCSAFASFDGPVFQLRSVHQRHLARCLCAAASTTLGRQEGGAATVAAAAAFFHQLLTPTLQHVQRLAEAASGPSNAGRLAAINRADVVDKTSCALERIRGSLEGGASEPQFALFDTVQGYLHALAALQTVYRQHALISRLLFKLAATLVETHIGTLPPDKAQALAKWCLGLLKNYRDARAGVLSSVQVGAGAAAEVERAEQASEIRALLKLLINLTQRFDDDVTNSLVEVVLEGVSTLLTLFTKELLQHPKLAEAYFRLALQLCETYPGTLAALPESHFAPLMQSLDWGLAEGDTRVRSQSLSALGCLAAYHHAELLAQRPGLQHHHLPGGSSVFAHFLPTILAHLLSDATPHQVTDMAADALLPMILSEAGTFVEAGQSLLGSQAADNVRAAIAEHLQQLIAGLSPVSIDRSALLMFRKRLHTFVAEIRGLVHKK